MDDITMIQFSGFLENLNETEIVCFVFKNTQLKYYNQWRFVDKVELAKFIEEKIRLREVSFTHYFDDFVNNGIKVFRVLINLAKSPSFKNIFSKYSELNFGYVEGVFQLTDLLCSNKNEKSSFNRQLIQFINIAGSIDEYYEKGLFFPDTQVGRELVESLNKNIKSWNIFLGSMKKHKFLIANFRRTLHISANIENSIFGVMLKIFNAFIDFNFLESSYFQLPTRYSVFHENATINDFTYGVVDIGERLNYTIQTNVKSIYFFNKHYMLLSSFPYWEKGSKSSIDPLNFIIAFVEDGIVDIKSREKSNLTEKQKKYMGFLNFPCKIVSSGGDMMIMMASILLGFTFSFVSATNIRLISSERNSKVDKIIQLTNVNFILNNVAWFICFFVVFIVYSLAFGILVHATHVFSIINAHILLAVLLSYSFAMTWLVILIGTLISSANLASAVITIMNITPLAIFSALIALNANIESGGIYLSSILFPATNFGFGLSELTHYDSRGMVVTPGRAVRGGFSQQMPNLLYLLFAQCLMGLFYAGLALLFTHMSIKTNSLNIIKYIRTLIAQEAIIDKKEPSNQSPYGNEPYIIDLVDDDLEMNLDNPDLDFIDKIIKMNENNKAEEPKTLYEEYIHKGFVTFSNVHVQYPLAKTQALTNICFNLELNQITCILGHNGAGKSTLIDSLCGLVKVSSGSISIDGKPNIENRNLIGFCPQNNILFNYLTVKEHFIFYSKLRDAKNFSVDSIEILLVKTKLFEKRNSRVDQLSGGMKRKLCIGISFIGDSKVIVLDEPTAGLDPNSRYAIWDLIMENREDKALLICTHFMDEVEVLSDKVLLMNEGKILFDGSIYDVKKKYSTMMRLILIKDENFDNIKDLANIEIFINEFYPNNSLYKKTENELIFHLNKFDNYYTYVSNLLIKFKEKKSEFKITSFFTDDETFDEIFIKAYTNNDSEDPDVFTEYDSKSLSKTLVRTNTANSKAEKNVDKHKNLSNSNIDCVSNVSKLDYGLSNSERDDKSVIDLDPFSVFNLLKDINPNVKFIRLVWIFIVRKIYTSVRNMKASLFQVLLPIVFMLATSPLIIFANDFFASPKIVINNDYLSYYEPQNLYLSFDVGSYEEFLKVPYMNKFTQVLFHGNILNEHSFDFDCRHYSDNLCPKNKPPIYSDFTAFRRNYKSKLLGDKINIRFLSNCNMSSYHLGTYSDNIYNVVGGYSLKSNGDVFIYADTKLTAAYGYLTNLLNKINIFVVKCFNDDILDVKCLDDDFLTPRISHFHQQGRGSMSIFSSVMSLYSLCFVGLGMGFLYSGFTVDNIHFTVSGLKHQMRTLNISRLYFNLSSYIADSLMFYVVGGTMLLLYYALGVGQWTNIHVAPSIIVAFILLGNYMIFYMNIFATLFKSTSLSFIALGFIFGCPGQIFSILPLYLMLYARISMQSNIYLILDYVSMIFPTYPFFIILTKATAISHLMGSFDSSLKYFQYFDRNFYGMIFHLVLSFTINLIIEYKQGVGIKNDLRTKKKRFYAEKTDEVRQKALQIRNLDDVATEEYNAVINGKNYDYRVVSLMKEYKVKKKKNFCAVNNVSFALKKGECFGLLGINGAGKSTIFNIISDKLEATQGFYEVITPNIGRRFSYCPQFDALDDFLTVKEQFRFFGVLCGYNDSTLEKLAQLILQNFNLIKYEDILVKNLSLGNKRKLSASVSLLGDPLVFLLDEPTTGMDPKSRRDLWAAIRWIISMNKIVIFTSHSMDECQELCNRICIMSNGVMKCIGNPEYIRNKYSSSFKVVIKLLENSGINEEFIEILQNKVKCQIDIKGSFLMLNKDLNSDEMALFYAYLSEQLDKQIIADFSITKSSLKDAFLNIICEDND